MTSPLDSSSIALEQAVRRVQGGDPDAFADIIRQLEGPARAWVVHRCPPGLLADEVAHQAFVVAFERLQSYQPGGNFRAWFYAILRNIWLTECARVRDRGRAHARLVDHIRSSPQPETNDFENEEVELQVQALRRCSGRLSEAAQDLLNQRYHQNQDLQTIATSTGRSLGAIKKAFFTIRKKLLACLEASGVGGAKGV